MAELKVYNCHNSTAIFCIDDFYKVSDVEPILNSAQQLKAEICSTCGYFPCVNRKQFEGTIITHCTQYYKLSAV